MVVVSMGLDRPDLETHPFAVYMDAATMRSDGVNILHGSQ